MEEPLEIETTLDRRSDGDESYLELQEVAMLGVTLSDNLVQQIKNELGDNLTKWCGEVYERERENFVACAADQAADDEFERRRGN